MDEKHYSSQLSKKHLVYNRAHFHTELAFSTTIAVEMHQSAKKGGKTQAQL